MKLFVMFSNRGSCSNMYINQAGKGVKQVGHATRGSSGDVARAQVPSEGDNCYPALAECCFAKMKTQYCQIVHILRDIRSVDV